MHELPLLPEIFGFVDKVIQIQGAGDQERDRTQSQLKIASGKQNDREKGWVEQNERTRLKNRKGKNTVI